MRTRLEVGITQQVVADVARHCLACCIDLIHASLTHASRAGKAVELVAELGLLAIEGR